MSDIINSLILLFVTLIAGIVILVIIHELGHLSFGLLSNYCFLIFRIWKLALVRTSSRYTFYIIKKPDSFGQCIMYPNESNQNPKIMMYGGIVFNLLCGILLIILGVFLSDHIFKYMFKIVGGMNIISALFNYASKYMTDDGQSIRDMKNLVDIKCYNYQLMIAKHLLNGDSFKDMDSKIFMIESLLSDSSTYEKEMYFYGYYRLLELGHFKQAKERIYMLEESGIEGWLAKEVRRERIFFYNMSNFKSQKIKNALNTPNDVRINYLNASLIDRFNRYIYPGEVKSTRIILEEIGRQYLDGCFKN